jgi:hypothetical protein
MKFYKVILLVCLAVGAVAIAQSPSPPGPSGSAAGTPVGPDAQSRLLHILSPASGQQLKVSYVDLSYELVNPGMSGGEVNFILQLDAQDPVNTRDTTYTFTGVTPGQHSVTVQLVDANGTPVNGGRTSVVFFVASPPPSQTAPGPSGAVGDDQHKLAPAASPLPLISVIGFGALLGGLASAFRNHK